MKGESSNLPTIKVVLVGDTATQLLVTTIKSMDIDCVHFIDLLVPLSPDVIDLGNTHEDKFIDNQFDCYYYEAKLKASVTRHEIDEVNTFFDKYKVYSL